MLDVNGGHGYASAVFLSKTKHSLQVQMLFGFQKKFSEEFRFQKKVTTQLEFTCSKSTIETPEQGVKYVKS